MRIAITGGRDHRPSEQEMEAFEKLWDGLQGTSLLHGACPSGVDLALFYWANHRNVPDRAFPAEWTKHGRAAGPIRNREMMREADALIAFPGGRGTESCIRAAMELDKRVFRVGQ